MSLKDKTQEELASIALDMNESVQTRIQALELLEYGSHVFAQIVENRRDDVDLRLAALTHGDFSMSEQSRLATSLAANPDECFDLREEALRSPYVTAEVLEQIALSKEEGFEVRMMALDHPNLSPEVAAKVAGDTSDDWCVRAEAVGKIQPPGLIAAAPDLLVACLELISASAGPSKDRERGIFRALRLAVAAVAKANGTE